MAYIIDANGNKIHVGNPSMRELEAMGREERAKREKLIRRMGYDPDQAQREAQRVERRFRAGRAVLGELQIRPDAMQRKMDALIARYVEQIGNVRGQVQAALDKWEADIADDERWERDKDLKRIRDLKPGDALAADLLRRKMDVVEPAAILAMYRQGGEFEKLIIGHFAPLAAKAVDPQSKTLHPAIHTVMSEAANPRLKELADERLQLEARRQELKQLDPVAYRMELETRFNLQQQEDKPQIGEFHMQEIGEARAFLDTVGAMADPEPVA